MQNYMGLSRNTGTFDPNRHVEGDIFRIGMHLEDIKEMIDRNVCEQMSPPCSSSTPTSVNELLDAKLLCMSTPSPLHEVIVCCCFCFGESVQTLVIFSGLVSGLKHRFCHAASQTGALERTEQEHEGGQQKCHITDEQ